MLKHNRYPSQREVAIGGVIWIDGSYPRSIEEKPTWNNM